MKFRTKIAAVGLAALSVVGATASAQAASTDADTLNGVPTPATTPSSDRTSGPEAKPKAHRYAVVESDGTLARGKNAWSAAQVAGGTYEVFFDRDVTGCAYQATIGTTSIGTAPAGLITVASRVSQPTGVWVDTSNLDGTDGERAFHLVVSC